MYLINYRVKSVHLNTFALKKDKKVIWETSTNAVTSLAASNVHVCLFEQHVGFSYNRRPSISTKGVMGPLSCAVENRGSWGQKMAGPPPKTPHTTILVTPPNTQPPHLLDLG